MVRTVKRTHGVFNYFVCLNVVIVVGKNRNVPYVLREPIRHTAVRWSISIAFAVVNLPGLECGVESEKPEPIACGYRPRPGAPMWGGCCSSTTHNGKRGRPYHTTSPYTPPRIIAWHDELRVYTRVFLFFHETVNCFPRTAAYESRPRVRKCDAHGSWSREAINGVRAV